jgi:hypothetical protein
LHGSVVDPTGRGLFYHLHDGSVVDPENNKALESFGGHYAGNLRV